MTLALDHVLYATSDLDAASEWLGGVDLGVRVVEGEPAVRAIGIGERTIR